MTPLELELMKFVKVWWRGLGGFMFGNELERIMRQRANEYLNNCPVNSPGYVSGHELHRAANIIHGWFKGKL